MSDNKAAAAAAMLWQHWQTRTRINSLASDVRPADRAGGYAVQKEIVKLARQKVVGWKIAATSQAGQTHIGVDGPLAAPLLASRVVQDSPSVPVFSMDGNVMKVAEAEFAFRLGKPLPRRATPYSTEEVLAAVASLHPAIEVPDSRYNEFAGIGAPQLIADMACACWFALGPETKSDWRARDLVSHQVRAYTNDALVATGTGANVLGDPRIALTWIANELSTFGDGIEAGQFVTTGTCVVPPAVAPGDTFRADFGELGSVEVRLA